MPKTKISEYSSTANSNTDVASINVDEGCAPSGINNAIRAVMGHLKDFQTGAVSDPLTVGGVLTVTGGSAGTPAITTSGDTNTGIFFPAADTIAFSEGGAEAARIDSSGNFGLGVTPAAWGSPFKALQFGPNGGSLNARTDSNQAVELALNWYYDGAATKYINSNYATKYRQFAGAHEWYTSAFGTAGNAITFTQAMTLDVSGNLLVGTTTSSFSAANRTVFAIGSGSSGSLIDFQVSSTSSDGYIYFDGTNATIENSNAGYVRFNTSGAERARIDSSGNLLVGTTSATVSGAARKLAVVAGGGFAAAFNSDTAANETVCIHNTATSGTRRLIVFKASANTGVGDINSDGTSTTYGTTSDYRLKTVVGSVLGAGERIDALKPIEYTWKTDGLQARGFLAHQFQEVYASSVSGIKDAVDAEGNPVYQSMQASSSEVIADLVAEIQSLRKRLAAAGI